MGKLPFTNAPNPRKWWSTVKTAVFGVTCSLPPLVYRGARLVMFPDENTSVFWRTWKLKSEDIVFSNRILVTLVQYSFLLPFDPALFVVWF